MDNRLHSRVSAEPQCKARFQLGGQSYDNITVANLGSDGCCMKIPVQTIAAFNDRSVLESLVLMNPGLPKGAIRGRVAWVHGQDKTRSGFIDTGIQFVEAPVDYTRGVVNYLVTRTHSQFPDPDGRPELPD